MKDRAISLLQDLIRIDTSNPPGNEWSAVGYLVRVAEELGFVSRSFGTHDGRGNVAISYNGSFHRPLILLSHLDVVPATPEQWTHPPFGAHIVDGEIWGRGAIDTKQLTVMHLVAMVLAREAGLETTRDILLVATSDEETGSVAGLKAMLDTPEALWFDGAEVLTEGGGFPLMVQDTPVYLIQTGQKGLAQLRFTIAEGRTSNPFLPTLDAADRAGEVVRILEGFASSIPEEIPDTTNELIAELTKACGLPADGLEAVTYERLRGHLTPSLDSFVASMMSSTVVPTVWNGGRRHPVDGGVYEIKADARLLPWADRGVLERLLELVAERTGATGEILSFEQGFESPRDPVLFRAIRESLVDALAAASPDHAKATGTRAAAREGRIPRVVPFLSSGGSDARHLRDRSLVMYGYSPVLPDMPFDRAVTLVHGVDERISTESLWFGCRVMSETLKRYLSPGGGKEE